MKLSKLIESLESKLKNIGDMDVYVNGEHGIGECEILQESRISVGSANLSFDTDDLDIDDSDIVCHIGGY